MVRVKGRERHQATKVWFQHRREKKEKKKKLPPQFGDKDTRLRSQIRRVFGARDDGCGAKDSDSGAQYADLVANDTDFGAEDTDLGARQHTHIPGPRKHRLGHRFRRQVTPIPASTIA